MLTRIALLGIALLPGIAFAQMPQGMDPAEMMKRFQDPSAMQRMAREAQAAQECLEGIPKSEIDALQKKAEEASSEIDALCAAGKKTEALAKGISLATEMRGNPTVQKLRTCSENMSETMEMMQSMPWAQIPGTTDDTPPTRDDICS